MKIQVKKYTIREDKCWGGKGDGCKHRLINKHRQKYKGYEKWFEAKESAFARAIGVG